MSIKNILIISNRGFIGKSIFKDLKNNKKYNIYGLNSDNCDLLNINKTKKTISKVIIKPFTIIFLSTFGRIPKDNYDVYNKNTTMISNLLNNIDTNLIEQFIFFSSTCLYGRPPNKIPIIETQECVPNGYYGLSKFVSESLIKLHLKCPISIIRIPGVYGELDNNKTITIYDKGLVLRDYVYINDILKVIKYIIDSNSNITINIATGKSISLINLIKLIENNLNKKAKINFLNSGHQQFDMTFNISSLMNFMPDFNPTYMEDGIKKYIYKKNIKFSSP